MATTSTCSLSCIPFCSRNAMRRAIGVACTCGFDKNLTALATMSGRRGAGFFNASKGVALLSSASSASSAPSSSSSSLSALMLFCCCCCCCCCCWSSAYRFRDCSWRCRRRSLRASRSRSSCDAVELELDDDTPLLISAVLSKPPSSFDAIAPISPISLSLSIELFDCGVVIGYCRCSDWCGRLMDWDVSERGQMSEWWEWWCPSPLKGIPRVPTLDPTLDPLYPIHPS